MSTNEKQPTSNPKSLNAMKMWEKRVILMRDKKNNTT
jgi:hypothetical protein